jgi:hypothetical protein
MTLKEKLIQAIERSPDDILEQLLEILQTLQPTALVKEIHISRLHRKQGVLIIQTEERSNLDVNTFINEIREERIQDQIQLVIQ